MTTSKKGSRRERELIHLFEDAGFAAIRATASGGGTASDRPDVLVANGGRIFAFEAKARAKGDTVYLTEGEVDALTFFAAAFRARAYIAVKWDYVPWRFYAPALLPRTDSGSFRVSYAEEPTETESPWADFEDLLL